MRIGFVACVVAVLLGACTPAEIAQPPRADATEPVDPPSAVEPALEAPASPGASSSDPSAPLTPSSAPSSSVEVVLSGRPIQAYAIGDTHVFTLESDVRTRLVATAKAPPHAVKVLLEEDVLDGVKFESVGASRGRVFVVDTYGAMRSALPDGGDVRDEYVPGASTRILSAPQTLWLAELPQFLGDVITFRWFGAQPSQVPAASAQLVPTGAVGDVAVDDDALVYATRGSASTLRSWAPAATGARAGHKLLATLPEEGRAVGLDAQRAYVHLPTAKEIRGYDRATGASTTILSGTTFDMNPMIRSDGTSLYMLTNTTMRRCSLSSCASTLTVVAAGLVNARSLVVDATYAWIVSAAKGQPGAIARVPK